MIPSMIAANRFRQAGLYVDVLSCMPTLAFPSDGAAPAVVAAFKFARIYRLLKVRFGSSVVPESCCGKLTSHRVLGGAFARAFRLAAARICGRSPAARFANKISSYFFTKIRHGGTRKGERESMIKHLKENLCVVRYLKENLCVVRYLNCSVRLGP